MNLSWYAQIRVLSGFAATVVVLAPLGLAEAAGGYRRPVIKSRLGAYQAKSRLGSRSVGPRLPAVRGARISARSVSRTPYRFIEIADPYTRAEGLGRFFAEDERRKRDSVDITALARRGQLPLKGARLLLVGSFATSSSAVRNALARNAQSIAAFVRGGGTVAVLAQERADDARAAFLPKGLIAERGDASYDEVVLPGATRRHTIWRSPNAVSPRAIGKWVQKEPRHDYPSGVRAVSGAFRGLAGFAAIAARDAEGIHPAVVEASFGKGRFLLAAVSPDKVIAPANGKNGGAESEAVSKDASAWLANIVAYSDAVTAGRTPTVRQDPPRVAKQRVVEVRVVIAPASASGAPPPGLDPQGASPGQTPAPFYVSDGFRFHRVDSAGFARLTYPDDARVTLSLVMPPGLHVRGGEPHRVLALTPGMEPVRVDFDVARNDPPQSHDYNFGVVSDVHLGARDLARDSNTFAQRLAEVWETTPRPDFVLSLGDITAYAKAAEFGAYRKAVAEVSPRDAVVVTAMGNHDVTYGPDRTERFERLMGPAFSVFHHGTRESFDRFVVGYELPGSPERRAWLEAALSLSPKPRRTFIVQHHYPSRALTRLARGRADAIFSGDWHTARVTRDSGLLSITTGSFTFGGLDQTPAGFRLVSVRGDAGAISTRARSGLVHRRLDVIEPAQGASCRGGILPILVSAYDSRAQVSRVSFKVDFAGDSTGAAAEPKTAASELTPFGAGQWRGAWECAPSTRGSAVVEIAAEDVRGATWAAKRSVKLQSAEIRVASLGAFRPTRAAATDAVAPPFSLAWIASTGGEAGPSQPVAARGLLLMARAERDDADNSRGALVAFDRTTGDHRWTFHAGASIESTPAVDSMAAYVTTVRGVMHSVRLSDGKPLWKLDMNSGGRSRFESRFLYQSPVVVQGGVLTGAAQHLVRLSPASGRPEWSFSAIGNDHLPNFARTVVDGHRLYVPSYSEGLHVIDSLSGALLWRTPRARVMAPVAVADDTVFVIEQHRLRALSTLDGRQRWQAFLGPGHHSAGPVANEDAVFVPDIRGNVTAFRAKDGHRLWSTRVVRTALFDSAPYLRRDSGGLTATPALSGRTLFVGGHDGVLTALDTDTGRVLDRRALGAPVLASPTVAGEMVYVATQAGSVFALRGTAVEASPKRVDKRIDKRGKKSNHRVTKTRRNVKRRG